VESKGLLAHGQSPLQNRVSRARRLVQAAARSTFHFAGRAIGQTQFHCILHRNYLADNLKKSSKPCAAPYNPSNNKNLGLDDIENPRHWRDCARDWKKRPPPNFWASSYARLRAALCEIRWKGSQLARPFAHEQEKGRK